MAPWLSFSRSRGVVCRSSSSDRALVRLFQLVDLGQKAAGSDRGRRGGVTGGDVAELADVALVAGPEQPGQEAGDAVRGGQSGRR